MATKNFRSTVLEPTSEFAHGDKLRFTALATVGEVLKGSFSETTIGEDGVYSIDLQYGKHRIDYKPYEGCWRHFADVEVNADTLATTLQDLALASVPVTDETILVLQGILADAAELKTETAESAAAAAADAAKLADVTPESIGAVSLSDGNVAVKPISSAATSDYIGASYLIIESPEIKNTAVSICVNLASSSVVDAMDYVFLSYYNHSDSGSVSALSCRHIANHNLTVTVYSNADKSKVTTVISRDSGFVNCYAGIVSAMSYSGASKISEGWTVSFSNDIPAGLTLKSTVIAGANGSVSSPSAVRLMELNGVTYHHIEKDEAVKVGIDPSSFDSALAEQQAQDLFDSEKSIALQIFADFNLGTGEHEITGADISDVRAYIQSIDPAKGLKAGHLQRAKIPRPSIFDRYS